MLMLHPGTKARFDKLDEKKQDQHKPGKKNSPETPLQSLKLNSEVNLLPLVVGLRRLASLKATKETDGGSARGIIRKRVSKSTCTKGRSLYTSPSLLFLLP